MSICSSEQLAQVLFNKSGINIPVQGEWRSTYTEKIQNLVYSQSSVFI